MILSSLRSFFSPSPSGTALPELGSAPAEPSVGSGYDPHYAWPTNLHEARDSMQGVEARLGQNESRLHQLGQRMRLARVGVTGGWLLGGAAAAACVVQAVALSALAWPLAGVALIAGGLVVGSMRRHSRARRESEALELQQYDLRAEWGRAQLVANALAPQQPPVEEQPVAQPAAPTSPVATGAPKVDDALMRWLLQPKGTAAPAAADWKVGS